VDAVTGRLDPAIRHRGFALVRAGAWAEARPPLARQRQAHS
jgi:hypothetical protein